MYKIFYKKIIIVLTLIISLLMITACSGVNENPISNVTEESEDSGVDDTQNQEHESIENINNFEQENQRVEITKLYDDEANYDPTSIIIKLKKSTLSNERNPEIDNDLKDLGIEKLTYLLDTSTDEFEDTGIWFNALLNEGIDSKSIIEEINQLEIVELVELNYVYENEAIDFPDVIENPKVQEQWHLENAGVQDAWYWLEQEGYEAGGSSSVVIAIIDTGVDYKHIDLAANMWKNPNEIPNNGIDDDGNGFIDDVHGVNVVSDSRFHSGDPMDDHGHGTHVAGIAAAANNKEGIVGVAYNSKIMAIKAGNASGYFLQADIAEAILYAYDNGADVINMSFGGNVVSNLVQDALSVAYTRSVLVAAAGNNGLKNQPIRPFIDIYPAAYPYVIGVMSHGQNGEKSPFSNWDNIPYNFIEYDLYAPGEGIISTIPGNQYASWSGTSMAAPIVAGTVALLRSYFSDRDMYPNKYIMGQIISTGDGELKHLRLNAIKAITTTPKPILNMYDFYGFDSIFIDAANNGDKIIDAGELINFGITLKNRWGMAENVVVTIDALSKTGIPNPHLDFVVDTVDYGGVGTYSLDDNGMVIEQQEVVGIENPFQVRINPDTPNDMIFNINVTITYNNGLDKNDLQEYRSESVFTIEIRNGVVLPSVIESDMILTSDKYYIISRPTLIDTGVSVFIEPGTTIYFKNSIDILTGELIESSLNVRGVLTAEGTIDNLIKFEAGDEQIVDMRQSSGGLINLSYFEIENPQIKINNASNGLFYQSELNVFIVNQYKNGYIGVGLQIIAEKVENSIFKNFGSSKRVFDCILGASINNNLFINSSIRFNLGKGSISIPDKYYMGYSYSNVIMTPGVSTNNLFLGNGRFIYDPWDNDGGYYRPSYLVLGQESAQVFSGNVILNNYNIDFLQSVLHIYADNYLIGNFLSYGIMNLQTNVDFSSDTIDIGKNYWGGASENIVKGTIHDFYDNFFSEKITYLNSNQGLNLETMFPFVTNAYLLNSQKQEVLTVGNETATFVVEFSRDMDMMIPLDVRFGSSMPYAEYQISGEYVTPRRWEGTYTLKTTIENGYQYWSITNGAAADDSWFILGQDVGRFKFKIDTTSALALVMQGSANAGGIDLSWYQDDFDTLAGYNVYRSTSEDGYYQRLNDYIIPYDTKTFFDDSVEPGVVYYYNFTVIKTDLTESEPSGKIVIQSLDTMAPNIYHTPVYETFINQNLLIRANIIDNLAIQSTKVYYRTIGETDWNVINMTANNDQYSAVIPSSVLSVNGLEYYIEAYDGISYTYKGIDTDPYQVVVKNAIDENAYGDVNGDGVITVLDALMLLQAINDRINLTSDQFLRADLNENGVLEAWEALRILQYTSGKVTTIR